MPELSHVSWTDLVRRLRKLGFDGPYQGGKHPYMTRGNLVLTIPNPHRMYEKATFVKSELYESAASSGLF